ncbi:hypothetical protein C804_04794 [Lachnospiraceae bacterium A4]|nr:hypothetical protein C804_04794 [Lachnospiraceae bacterium A4]
MQSRVNNNTIIILEIEDKIQWHPAFCSAMELELREYKKYLRYEREHNLGKMPLKIDFLVIRKNPSVTIKNDIGDFFLGNNIFEYKSPGDDMNIGTFYKALSYACLYKSEAGNVSEILNMDITVSLVREQKPVILLEQLAEKYEVIKKSDGIYRISGLLFPIQILATGELDPKTHVWVTSLTRTIDRIRTQRLLNSCSELEDDEDRRNADSVVNVTSEANIELFKRMIQEGDQMCEELKEMLAPEIMEFKIRLADKDAKLADKDARLADKDARLADKDAEIAKLKKMLTDAGIKI